MKTKDLVVGTKYAVKDCGTNCATYLSAGWSEHGSIHNHFYRQDGGSLLLVEFEPGLFGSKKKTQRYVRPQAIIDLWEPYEAARTAKRVEAEAAYAHQKMTDQQHEARLRNAKATLQLYGVECHIVRDTWGTLCITFTPAQAERLLQHLFEIEKRNEACLEELRVLRSR